MARQIGSTFRGTTPDGLTFYYNRRHGHLVRRTGGITSKQYHKDNRYAAARDASSEFCTVSSSGKLIREALGEFLPTVKDGTMVNRLNAELVALKQLDTIHSRGQRRPDTMMADTTANLWFRIFQFNEEVKLYDLTEHFPQVERNKQRLAINNIQLKASEFPEGATHAGLTLVRTVIDFDEISFKTCSSRMAIVDCGDCGVAIHRDQPTNWKSTARDRDQRPASTKSTNLSLELSDMPSCKSIELVCIQILFFREHNGDLVQLKGKVHAMGIISINQVCGVAIDRDHAGASVVTRFIASNKNKRVPELNALPIFKYVETGCILSTRRPTIHLVRGSPPISTASQSSDKIYQQPE